MSKVPPGMTCRAALVGMVLGLASCADHKATALVLAVSAEPGVVHLVEQVEISAYRGAETRFSQPYDLSSDVRLPATLTFSKIEDAPDDQAILYKIIGRDASGTARISRQARLGFVKEHTKLLRMPLETSCLDHAPCKDDETCSGGACVKDSVDPGGLPDFTSNGDVLGTAGTAGNSGAGGTAGQAGSGG